MRDDLGSVPTIRGFKYFASQMCQDYGMTHKIWKFNVREFPQGSLLMKRIEELPLYKLYKAEKAVLMESSDIEKLRNMSVWDAKNNRIDRYRLNQKHAALLYLDTAHRNVNVACLQETEVDLYDLNTDKPEISEVALAVRIK